MELRKITNAFATNIQGFARGTIVAVTGKCPKVLLDNSEPYKGAAPADAVEVDGSLFESRARRASRPWIPTAVEKIDDAGILAAYRMSVEDWAFLRAHPHCPEGSLTVSVSGSFGEKVTARRVYHANEVRAFFEKLRRVVGRA